MSARDGAGASGISPGAWLGRAAAILLLLVFALFFVVPLVWLVIAPTKTDRQLLLDAPFAFGSLGTLVDNWNSLVAYQGGLLWTWIGNSAFYCIAALAITLTELTLKYCWSATSLSTCLPAGRATFCLPAQAKLVQAPVLGMAT